MRRQSKLFWDETVSQLSNFVIFKKEIKTMNNVLWLFNHCSTSVQAGREVIIYSPL